MNVSVINDGTNHSGDELDPAASSTSGGGDDSNDPIRLSDSSTVNNIQDIHDVVADTPTDEGGRESSSATEQEDSRLEQFRSVIDPDHNMPIDMLREIYEENRRASANRATVTSAAPAAATVRSSAGDIQRSSTRSAPAAQLPPRRDGNRWERCRPASSRPGVVSVGGQRTGQIYPVGQMDEIELIQKKINAVHNIQETLNRKLTYNLQSRKQEVERIYEEEQRMLESTRLDQTTEENKLVPSVKTWDAPSDDMLKKEPALPSPKEPLPLPPSFVEEGLDNIGNREIALGRVYRVYPGEDEEKQEEDVSIENRWAEVSPDDSTLGAYDRVVRCWKCRAELKINLEIGLVVCPRCRSISPTTDVEKTV